jgi:hypothetical protein
MSKRTKKNEHVTEPSVPDAIEALVGYFQGYTCRGCAFQAADYLVALLQRDEAQAAAAWARGDYSHNAQ